MNTKHLLNLILFLLKCLLKICMFLVSTELTPPISSSHSTKCFALHNAIEQSVFSIEGRQLTSHKPHIVCEVIYFILRKWFEKKNVEVKAFGVVLKYVLVLFLFWLN